MHIGIIFVLEKSSQTIISLSAYSDLLRFLKWLEIDLQSLIFFTGTKVVFL